MFKKLFLVLLLIPVIAFAQSSGKITGVVIDQSTGEPLPGVNVILEGTMLGASTDIDGYFVILNVPVGTYDLRANYIGYKDVLLGGLRVSAGITTEANFDLEPTTLELEEAIVITAERPLVEKNVTQSISLVTSEQLESIPVRGFNNLIQLQNSVIVQDGNVHIRGGRPEETGYYIDGAAANCIMTNTQAVYVIQEAIEEFQVLAGGYTAEFGGANSGIIRTELKTGGSNYHFSVDAQTDKFVNESHKFLDTYSYQHHNLVATVSGPLIGNKIRFFVAGENNFQGDDEVRFSRGYVFDSIPDLATNRPEDTKFTVFYPEGFTPHNKTNRYSLNGSLLFDYSPVKFRLSGSYSKRRSTRSGSYREEATWVSILDNRLQYDMENTMLFSGKITHVLNPTTYYELTLSYYADELERNDDYFENDWAKWYDSTAVYQHTGGDVIYRDRWREQWDLNLLGFPMRRDGDPTDYYLHTNQQYLGGALNFVSQIGKHHEVKAGVDARLYTIRHFDIRPSVMLYTADPAYSALRDDYPTTYGSIDAVPADKWVLNGNVDAFGYDIYGNKTDSKNYYDNNVYTEGPKKPIFFSAYLHDKIEWSDLIINAGLRVDYFDSDDKDLINPTSPTIDQASGLVVESDWREIDPFVQVSPRLGFSFPITEKTVFYSQYGKFIQLGQLDQIYFSTWVMSRQLRGGYYYINPVGFGLDPIRTTSYELGFRQQISKVAAIDISGFYKNVKGQIQVDKIKVDPGSDVSDYERFVNQDFATTKGLEFRLTLRRSARIQAQVNYTLTDAKGTGSNNTAYHGAVYNTTDTPKLVNPLDYSQTHTGSVVFDYRFAPNDGGPILERLGANFLFSFSSGHPFTTVYAPPGGQVDPYNAGVDYMYDTRSREALEPIGSSRTPWQFYVDLRLDKTFTLMEKLEITLYARVLNLLNTQNELNVYQITGSARDDGFLYNPERSKSVIDQIENSAREQYGIIGAGETYTQIYQAMNLDNAGSYADQVGLEMFGRPRQIFFGIKLAY